MDSFNPKPNQELKTEEFIQNLFSLNQQQEEVFRQRIKESNGVVRIMIHPYYIQQNSPDTYDNRNADPNQRVDIVESGFEKILKTKSPTPVILFETYNQVKDTIKKLLPTLTTYGNKIYIVPTYNSSPVPSLGWIGYDNWKVLIRKMKSLGVAKIIIGGTYLWVNPKKYKPSRQQQLNGCVGGAIEALKSNFTVEISNLTHPDSRKDTMPSRQSRNNQNRYA